MNRTNNLKVVCYNASLQKLALSFVLEMPTWISS